MSLFLCSNFPFLTRTPATELGYTGIQNDLSFKLDYICKDPSYFQIWSHSGIQGDWEFKHVFLGDMTEPIIPL